MLNNTEIIVETWEDVQKLLFNFEPENELYRF